MKKGLKITLITLGIILVVIAILALWQKDNISAFINALNHEPEQILEKINDNDKALKQELESHLSQTFREFTEEEKAQIERGEASEKEILAKIIAETVPPEEAEVSDSPNQPNPENPTQPSTTPAPKTADAIISKYVSTLYSMENNYIGSIEGVVSRAIAEFKSSGKSKNDKVAIAAIGAKYISEIYALESKCDGEVEALLANLKKELNEINADTSIISTIRSAYQSEKQLKRSYYMGKYMK